MPRNTPELDPRLAQLYGLNQMNQQQDSANTENTAAMVKMLSELYGLSQQPQKMALDQKLGDAHANYYNTESQGLVENRKAEGVMRNAAALRSMAEAGLPREAIEAQAKEFGFIVPEAKKPMGAFDAGKPDAAATNPPRSTAEKVGAGLGLYAKALGAPLTASYYEGKKAYDLFKDPNSAKYVQQFLTGLTQ